MILLNNVKLYGTMWKQKVEEKYTDIALSTSENREGERIYSRWYARLIGQAHNALKDAEDGAFIVITGGKLTREKSATDAPDGNPRYFMDFIIYNAEKKEFTDYNHNVEPVQEARTVSTPANNSEPDLPF